MERPKFVEACNGCILRKERGANVNKKAVFTILAFILLIVTLVFVFLGR